MGPEQQVQSHEYLYQAVIAIPLLPHCPQQPQTRGDQAGQLRSPRTSLHIILHALRRRPSSTAAAAFAPTSVGTTMSFGSPSPSYPNPQQWRQRQG
jgi:hypothetical protein